MDQRKKQLAALNEFIENVDKETTMLLQHLQWDHKHLVESRAMVTCKYDAGHRIPAQSAEAHERQCFLDQLGYSKDEILLPDAVDHNALKLSNHDIMNIINAAAASDPLFKRGSEAVEPLSVSRLQTAYSADERRAIHDAVVAAVPSVELLSDLPLPSGSSRDARGGAVQSREAVLAELRDMKRRRARYRVRSTTAHYSDVLRDLIKTQMELYAEARGIFIKTEYGPKTYVSLETKAAEYNNSLGNLVIKQERFSPDSGTRGHHTNTSRYRSRSRERRRQTESNGDRSKSRDRRQTEFRERNKHSHRSDYNSGTIVIKQERHTPDKEHHYKSIQRDRSRGRDRRRQTESTRNKSRSRDKQTEFKERNRNSHRSENNSGNIEIKQERLSPHNERHYERSKRDRSRDRKSKTEHMEREYDSHTRRHNNYGDDSSELKRSRDYRHDTYYKDSRRHEKHTNYDNGIKCEHSTSSRELRQDDHKNHNKHNDKSYANYSKTSRDNSSSKDYNEYCRRKHDEHETERTSKHASYSSRNDDKQTSRQK